MQRSEIFLNAQRVLSSLSEVDARSARMVLRKALAMCGGARATDAQLTTAFAPRGAVISVAAVAKAYGASRARVRRLALKAGCTDVGRGIVQVPYGSN